MKHLEHIRHLVYEGRLKEGLGLSRSIVALAYVAGHEAETWMPAGIGGSAEGWGGGGWAQHEDGVGTGDGDGWSDDGEGEFSGGGNSLNEDGNTDGWGDGDGIDGKGDGESDMTWWEAW